MKENLAIYLRQSDLNDCKELEAAFERSKEFHIPWLCPPKDIKKFTQLPNLYLVCLQETDEIVGTFHISEIVRGFFQSACLGYQAFVPHQGKGYMSQGLKLLIKEAFEKLNLHRLEANIQPGNHSSIALVSGAGFQKEGFSPKYLRAGNQWLDLERWAIINNSWEEKSEC